MFEFLRKFLLLMALFVAGLGTYLSALNATDWQETLWVEVYPIAGDTTTRTAAYIKDLERDDFAAIERFMEREARRYGVAIERPVKMVLGPTLGERPPQPPIDGSIFAVMHWSLDLRWWTYSITKGFDGPRPDIKLFLVYFDPKETAELDHSVGLQKGRVGIVNVFADSDMAATNNFVIAHEMLHTLGATDKYGPPDLLPFFPSGYGEPDKMPLYPQTIAELMGGRIALSETDAVMPRGLRETRIGPDSALEIRWIK